MTVDESLQKLAEFMRRENIWNMDPLEAEQMIGEDRYWWAALLTSRPEELRSYGLKEEYGATHDGHEWHGFVLLPEKLEKEDAHEEELQIRG